MTTASIGVGGIGSAPARNLVRDGEDVVLASRSHERAQAVADGIGVRTATVDDAIAAADAVILAVWFDAVRELLTRHAAALSGRSSSTRPTPSRSTATAGSRRASRRTNPPDGCWPPWCGGIDQSIRVEVFGDLHELTLGSAPAEDQARKLIRPITGDRLENLETLQTLTCAPGSAVSMST